MNNAGCISRWSGVPRRCQLLMLAGLMCLLSGCGPGTDDRGEAAVAGKAEHGHEHGHEHHHHRPAHKPDDFQELAGELRRRLSPDAAGVARPSRRRLQQLREIVGWIPELAADSDLRRVGFEQAVAQQANLQRVLDGIAAGNSAEMAEWNAAVDRLQELADSLEAGVKQHQGGTR